MGSDSAAPRFLVWLTRLVLAVALLLLAIWLWSRVCLFPSIPWNDIRLAPSIALAQGWSVYPTASAGTITTWMYGPLPLLYHWPAHWAATAAGAMLTAAWLNLALTILPVALVCFAWPATDEPGDRLAARLAAFLGCLALWPALHYSVIFSDNLAIACGLCGNLLLVRPSSRGLRWLAAFFAVAAMGCKQICLGIPLAQVLWLALTAGRSEALRHLFRCLVCGLTLASGLITIFGWPGLWFTLIEIPAGLGLVPDFQQRLLAVAPTMAIHLGVPLFGVLAGRRWFTGDRLLPVVAWVCTLPFGFAGMLSLGGWTNSVHSFVLWLPPVMTALLTLASAGRLRPFIPLAAGLFAVSMLSGRLLQAPKLPLRPLVADYRMAAAIAARNPQGAWFPLNPLVTLYSDHRYYHDEDGLFVRQMSGKPPGPDQLVSQLPPALHLIVLHQDWTDWGIARRMLPKNQSEALVGNWIVRSGLAAQPSP